MLSNSMLEKLKFLHFAKRRRMPLYHRSLILPMILIFLHQNCPDTPMFFLVVRLSLFYDAQFFHNLENITGHHGQNRLLGG